MRLASHITPGIESIAIRLKVVPQMPIIVAAATLSPWKMW
jgi:hypothetical protein